MRRKRAEHIRESKNSWFGAALGFVWGITGTRLFLFRISTLAIMIPSAIARLDHNMTESSLSWGVSETIICCATQNHIVLDENNC